MVQRRPALPRRLPVLTTRPPLRHPGRRPGEPTGLLPVGRIDRVAVTARRAGSAQTASCSGVVPTRPCSSPPPGCTCSARPCSPRRSTASPPACGSSPLHAGPKTRTHSTDIQSAIPRHGPARVAWPSSLRPCRPPAGPSRSAEPPPLALVAAVAGPTLWLGGAPPGAAVLAALLSATALGLLVAADSGRLVVPPLAARPPRRRRPLRAPARPAPARARSASSARPWASCAPSPSSRSASTAGARSPTTRPPPPPPSPARSPPPPPSSPPPGSRRSRTSRRFLAAGIGLTGVAVALIGFGHALADASTLFGLHRFQNGQLPFLTPFGNPNHLAAFATLASTLLLGLAADSPSSARGRPCGSPPPSPCGASAFLSLSRGGIAFWCAGQVAFLLLLLRRRDGRGTDGPRHPRRARRGHRRPRRRLPRPGPHRRQARHRRHRGEAAELQGRPVAHVLPARRGRLAHRPRPRDVRHRLPPLADRALHADLHLRVPGEPRPPARHRARDPRDAGPPRARRLGHGADRARAGTGRSSSPRGPAWARCVLHDLFDFALELPACATAAAVALGIASGPWVEQHGAAAPPRAHARRARGRPRVLAVARARPRRRLGRPAPRPGSRRTPPGTPPAVRDEARALVDRHPADAVLYRIAGWTEATRPGGQPRVALAWLEPGALPPAARPGHPPRRRPRPVPARRRRPRPWSRSGSRWRPAPRPPPCSPSRSPGPATSTPCGTWWARRRRTWTCWSPSSGSAADRGRARAARPGAARLRRPPRGRRAHRHRGPHPAPDRGPGGGARPARRGRAGRTGRRAPPRRGARRARPPPRGHPHARVRRRPQSRGRRGRLRPRRIPRRRGPARPGPRRARAPPALRRRRRVADPPRPRPGRDLPRRGPLRTRAGPGPDRDAPVARRARPPPPGRPALRVASKRPREALREVEIAVSLSGRSAPTPPPRAWMDRLRTAIDQETVRALELPRGSRASMRPTRGPSSQDRVALRAASQQGRGACSRPTRRTSVRRGAWRQQIREVV